MSHRYKSFVNLLMLCLLCFSALSPAAVADTLTIPNSFTAGTPAQASQVNANFNAITSWSANIANDNIKSGAGIALTKLDQTTELFVKRAATNRCVSAGVTGDTIPRIALYTDGSIGMGPGTASVIDVGFARKDSSTIKALSITAPSSPVALHTAGMLVGSDFTSNYFAWLTTDGLHLTAGSTPATAGMVTGPSANTIAIRNNDNSADGALTCGALTASGAATVTGAATLNSTATVAGATTLNSTLTANSVVPGITPGGRLTLTSGTPVTGDVTAAGTLYYTPYRSNIYPAYATATGKYTAKTFIEASLTLSISSGTNYDIFGVYTSGSSPTLSALAWTNDTTRATALVRSTISGLLYKSGDEQSLYLGTIRGSGANVTAKSRAAGQLYVWNMYNRVMEDAQAQDTTDTWNYTTAAFQEARAQSTEGTSRIGIVRGLDDDTVEAMNISAYSNSVAAVTATNGIGIDSSTVNSATNSSTSSYLANQGVTCTAVYKGRPGIGYHTFRRLEYSVATGTCSWAGDGGGTVYQTGLRLSQPM